jgi:excisionase family DNA binding protein
VANPSDSFVSPARAAELLACSRRTIYRHVADGRIAALRFGSSPNAPLKIPIGSLVEQLHLIDMKEPPK